MEESRPFVSLFKQHAFVWKSDFSRRHEELYMGTEESSRLVEPILIGLPGQVIQQPAPTREEIIERFVAHQCDQEPNRYSYRTQLITNFLEDADFSILAPVPGGTEDQMRLMALIDDRNDSRGARGARTTTAGEQRQPAGALDPRRFFNELLKRRVGSPGEADAERRLIYTTDLNPTGALALVGTVSPRQGAFLRDFLYRYLTCQTLLGVEIPFTGWPTFALEFHIPYYAWRKSPKIRDNDIFERTIDGRPMRITEEVIQLQMNGQASSRPQNTEQENTNTPPEQEYIHQAQISVMVTGTDDWYWTVYCCVDTYFKGNRHRESVEFYSNQTPRKDPISCGRDDIDLPIWIPRHYFLRTLSLRMEQVKQEWSNAVFQLFQQTQPCIYSFTRGETDLNGPAELDITQQPGFKWTIRVLRQFAHLLSKTIDAWETFKDGEIRYFTLPQSDALAQPSWGRYFAAIDKDVTELKDLRKSLIHQTELFENMTNSIVTHAALKETVLTRLQAQFIQALTVITICYLPPTLASTFFSMQITILPSRARFTHWVYVLIGLLVTTILLVLNLRHIFKIIQSFGQWQDKALEKANQVLWVKTGLQQRWRSRNSDDADDGIELPARNQGLPQQQDAHNGEV